MIRYLFVVLCVLASFRPASAQTSIDVTLYNPVMVTFEPSPDHDVITGGLPLVTFYRVEMWLQTDNTTTGKPLQTSDIAKTALTVYSQGPPIIYQIKMSDVSFNVPFGPTYVLRLLACNPDICGLPSNFARQGIRYSYCASSPSATTVKPLTIAEPTSFPILSLNKYGTVSLTLDAPNKIHSVTFTLTGSGQPAFYFYRDDARGTRIYTLGPVKRAGNYLVRIDATDEQGCSSFVSDKYMSVR